MLNQKTEQSSVFFIWVGRRVSREHAQRFLRDWQLSLKSAEILLQAAVRGGLIESLICCALQYFSNTDLFHISKSCYCFGFANKYGNSILFIYLW